MTAEAMKALEIVEKALFECPPGVDDTLSKALEALPTLLAHVDRLSAELAKERAAVNALPELVAKVKRLKALLTECANELEAEFTHRHNPTAHPASAARWERDMETVNRARAELNKKDQP